MSPTTQALCCECGAVRTVPTRAPQAAADPYSGADGVHPSHLAAAQANGSNLGMQPYWRCLRILTCKVCGRPTRHAEIRQDAHRDHAEQQDREADVCRRELAARLLRLQLAGIDVRWCDVDDPESEWPLPSIAMIRILQIRDAFRAWWLIELAEGSPPGDLLDQLSQAERVIDRDELLLPWQDDESGIQWRGRAFRTR